MARASSSRPLGKRPRWVLLASLLPSSVTFSALHSGTNEDAGTARLEDAGTARLEPGPIIAVMAQPMASPGATDYLPASYVKWLELGGARVVPVMYEATDREVDTTFANTNGLLLIGGSAPICPAARRFLANALAAAKAGDAYPIWGTCDGFEWLMQMAAEEDGALHNHFDSENLPLPLNLTAAAADSRLLAEAGETMAQRSPKLSVLEALHALPVTFNSHKQGVTVRQPHVARGCAHPRSPPTDCAPGPFLPLHSLRRSPPRRRSQPSSRCSRPTATARVAASSR